MVAVFVPTKEDGTKTHWFTVMGMGAMLLCIKVLAMQAFFFSLASRFLYRLHFFY